MSPRHDPNAMPLDRLWAERVNSRRLDELIEAAVAEDIGQRADVTSAIMLAPDAPARAQLRARRDGRLCGARLIARVAKRYDQQIDVRLHRHDGDALAAGQTIATLVGPGGALLAAERVMLNFACHLSGIATLTARFVQAVAGTPAKIYDTRKTIPGYRSLAKYAVRCGGGWSHRMGLLDAVLIKDNHLAAITGGDLRHKLGQAVERARALSPRPAFVEVEVDTLEQLDAALDTPVDIVLLDNMGPDLLARAVAMRDGRGAAIELEASGGVTLDGVRPIAQAGVDRIAIGALTHSAPALDLGLDFER